ncbi:hypothetical protein M405DRAFT_830175 [Rhizopogon salebrosus TDB-379]|nr:hypothetical protein M405DRAFT_830175 [Rhizopogon salebrosus TDB-379]
MRDMIDVLMTHVHFLPDVLALRQVSLEIYSWCRAIPDRRLEGILRRFFQGDLDHFLTVMHETGTIITGSCALNMLLGECPVDQAPAEGRAWHRKYDGCGYRMCRQTAGMDFQGAAYESVLDLNFRGRQGESDVVG